MNLELSDQERKILLHAIETYLSDLKGEIGKSEKPEWKAGLREERDILTEVARKLT